MRDESFEFLRRLLTSPSPSGYEAPGQRVWCEYVRTFADEWSTLDIADPRWPGEERFLREPSGGWTLNAYGKLETPREFSGVAYAVDPVPSRTPRKSLGPG